MPDNSIEFVLVRDKETGAEKYIPRELYDNKSALWTRLNRTSVTTDQAPLHDPDASAPSGEKKSGQKAASTKENS